MIVVKRIVGGEIVEGEVAAVVEEHTAVGWDARVDQIHRVTLDLFELTVEPLKRALRSKRRCRQQAEPAPQAKPLSHVPNPSRLAAGYVARVSRTVASGDNCVSFPPHSRR